MYKVLRRSASLNRYSWVGDSTIRWYTVEHFSGNYFNYENDIAVKRGGKNGPFAPPTLAMFVSETLGEVANSVATEMASEARKEAFRYGISGKFIQNFIKIRGVNFAKLSPKKRTEWCIRSDEVRRNANAAPRHRGMNHLKRSRRGHSAIDVGIMPENPRSAASATGIRTDEVASENLIEARGALLCNTTYREAMRAMGGSVNFRSDITVHSDIWVVWSALFTDCW